MLPFKVVYHEKYDLNLGPHVFPSQKFRLIAEALIAEKIVAREDFVQPEPATDEDILRVHTPEWVRKLKTGTLTASEVMLLEIPYSRELVEAVWLAAGGSILAAQCALRDGFGANLGGGFHHAYPDHGEGFCAIHDYPAHKPPSSIDLHMMDRADDDEYLAALLPAVQKAIDEFSPELLFYVGGADPFCEDQLGGLSLTKNGLKERDRRVFKEARRRGIPVATALAGGYARQVEDTVRIHVNTIVAARDVASEFPMKTVSRA